MKEKNSFKVINQKDPIQLEPLNISIKHCNYGTYFDNPCRWPEKYIPYFSQPWHKRNNESLKSKFAPDVLETVNT